MNLSAGAGIAVREFPLETGPVDYLLYAGGKVIGVVEAKPEGHTLTGVEIQSSRYIMGVPAALPAWRRPPPFAYESTGAVTQFTNGLEPDARSREVFSFHRPEELVRQAKLEKQMRGALRLMPGLKEDGLWKVQTEAIGNLETSLAQGRPRALIQMATGSGKTFTAPAFSLCVERHPLESPALPHPKNERPVICSRGLQNVVIASRKYPHDFPFRLVRAPQIKHFHTVLLDYR